MLRVGRGLLSRLGVKYPQLSLNGFTSHSAVSVLNGNGHGLQSPQSHSPITFTNENGHFTFGSTLSCRTFCSTNGNTMKKNENENANEVVTNDLKLKEDAKKWLENRKMNQHWESVALWWDTNVGYAKKGERERMENNLMKKCEMEKEDAEATAQWFMDNFESSQETPKELKQFNYDSFVKQLGEVPTVTIDDTYYSGIRDEDKEKYKYANIDNLPVNPYDGGINFYFGDSFEKDPITDIKAFATISQTSPNPPTFSSKNLIDELPQTPGVLKKEYIFPLVQVSKAGKSFEIKELAKSRHILLIDFKTEDLSLKEYPDPMISAALHECSKICDDRDRLILDASSKMKNNDGSFFLNIHKNAFDKCNEIIQYMICSHLIYYLQSVDTSKNEFDFFYQSQTRSNRKYKLKIFGELLDYDINSVLYQLSDELDNFFMRNGNACPVFAVDECGILLELNSNLDKFMSRRHINTLNNMTDDEKKFLLDDKNKYNIVKQECRYLYDCFAQASGVCCVKFGIPMILAGTTMKLYKLVEGYSSPFKPSEVKVCRPMSPLSMKNVKNIINKYLNISIDDIPDSIAYHFSGRSGILVECLLTPYLNFEFEHAKDELDWKNQFVNFANKMINDKMVENMILRFVDKTKMDSMDMYFNKDKKRTLEYGLCCLYYDFLFQSTNVPPLEGYSEGLPQLIDKGIVYVNKYSSNTYYGSIVEPAGINALEMLFKNKSKEKDLFFKELKHEWETSVVVKGYVFELLLAYSLIKLENKPFSEISFLKPLIDSNPEFGNYCFCGKYFKKSLDDETISQMINFENTMQLYWIQSKGYAVDIMGIAQNMDNTDEKIIVLLQSKCLGSTTVMASSKAGVASLLYETKDFQTGVTVPAHWLTENENRQRKYEKQTGKKKDISEIEAKDGLLLKLRQKQDYIGLFVTNDSNNVTENWNIHDEIQAFLQEKQETTQVGEKSGKKYKIFHIHFKDILNDL